MAYSHPLCFLRAVICPIPDSVWDVVITRDLGYPISFSLSHPKDGALVDGDGVDFQVGPFVTCLEVNEKME